MIKVKGLNWNQQREEHILRHRVTPDEVDEVVLEPGEYGWFDPVTARDATQGERRLYLKKLK